MNVLLNDALTTLRRYGLAPEVEESSHIKIDS